MESLTSSLIEEATKLLDEIENLGGMTKALSPEFRNSESKPPPPVDRP